MLDNGDGISLNAILSFHIYLDKIWEVQVSHHQITTETGIEKERGVKVRKIGTARDTERNKHPENK